MTSEDHMSQTPDRPPVIVGLGEILWDNLPRGRLVGGAPANFAYHAHVLGAESVIDETRSAQRCRRDGL